MPSQTNSPISAKPRINAVAQYLLALAAVVGAYSAYAKLAVPLIEGPPSLVKRVSVNAVADLPSTENEKSHLAPLLPAGAWELDQCKTLLIDAGTILFKELEQLDDGSMNVVPFTLITGLENTSANPPGFQPKTPTVLRCVSGAKLKFNKPIQEVFSGGGKLESARLTGEVNIYRPPSSPSANDAMHIATSNVQVDKRRIYTLDTVEFSFGPNSGSGRNMLIDLTHESDTASVADFSNVNGVRRLELAFLDRLRIEPAKKSAKTITPGGKSKQIFSGSKSPLEISCQGPFVFDFDGKTASFEDQVIAKQVDAFEDQISCDKLILIFEDKPESLDELLLTGANNLPPKALEKKFSGDLQLKQFIAEGSPAAVTSRSKSAKFSGEYLSYNVLKNQIVGKCGADNNEMVTIVSPEYQLVAKQLTYAVPDDGSLGEINAIGAGRLLRVETPAQDEFFTTWTNSLTTRAIPEQPGLMRVVVDGAAKIRIANTTNVNADRMEVHVWEIARRTTNEQGEPITKWEYHPSKLFTTGNVSIASPKLDGNAQHLTATWPDPQIQFSSTNPPPLPYQVGYRGTLPLQSPASQPSRLARINQQSPSHSFPRTTQSGFVEKTDLSAAPKQQNGLEERVIRDSNIRLAGFNEPAKRKLNFRGETVDVRLNGSGDQSTIQDLTVVGDVKIVEQSLDVEKQTEQPLTITGHRLQLTPQTREGNYRTLITGKNEELATVSMKDFVLNGQSINLDQEANKIWVEGEGTMKLSVVPKPKPDEIEVPLDPENLDVSWKGGMIFDGAKIYFERDVMMSADRPDKDGKRSNIQSLSAGLSVELSEPIEFQNIESDQKLNDAKILELVFVDDVPESIQRFKLAKHQPDFPTQPNRTIPLAKRPVVIKNRTFDKLGKLVEQQRFVVPNAVIDAQSGSVKSKGPGSIATHRLGKPSDPSRKDSTPFAGLGKTSNKSGISFIQINFDGELNVNAERRNMTLQQNIRTVYAPVPNWETTFNPDLPQQRGPGSVFLTCDNLQLAQWEPRAAAEKTNELTATGNAHIKSDTFEATANRVSYSQETDLLVIVGTPRTKANIWTDSGQSTADKFSYRLSDQRIETEGVTFEINQK